MDSIDDKSGVLAEECPIHPQESRQGFCILLVASPENRAGLKARILRETHH
jgi:hypothetical protein